MGEVFENFDEHQQEEIPIESVFGLWKDRNITKETLRKKHGCKIELFMFLISNLFPT